MYYKNSLELLFEIAATYHDLLVDYDISPDKSIALRLAFLRSFMTSLEQDIETFIYGPCLEDIKEN